MYTLPAVHESSLHSSLKQFYLQDGGFSEWWLDGYWIDVFKQGQLIEIQTGKFSSLRSKFDALLNDYPIRVVYPIARQKFIVMNDRHSNFVSRRKSPKSGRFEEIFNQLIYIIKYVNNPNFSLEILITSEEELRRNDGLGSWWRRGVSIIDRRLVSVLDRWLLLEPADYARFVDPLCDQQFTNTELAARLKIPRRLAGKMTYCLAQLGVISCIEKRKNAHIFQRTCG
ncbi:MAG: hypothetical protein B6D39_03440 [Anaerolineae bacterium UTCFX2]|nr:hypothetical protein [Anaerolineales bacterium]OQY93158.1 MAG: hypothetical protein B6D39_03440 [Anaerolineae bacterium UTCFX2]